MVSGTAIIPRARRRTTLVRVWLFLLVVVVTLAMVAAIMIPRGSAAPTLSGGTILPGRLAPNFRLTDQFGRKVQLSQLRGHPVVMTFLEANCKKLCPVVAETIHRSLAEMGPAGKSVKVIAIDTDPEGDTPAIVRRFSQQHGLYHRWLYLTAARHRLRRVWAQYYVYAAPASAAPAVRDSAHTSATYLVDRSGRERLLMTGNPGTGDLVRDLHILSGLPATGGDVSVPAPEVGHPAPSLSLPALSGRTIDLSSYRGHVVLINFWATWCKPCRSEMPMLADWYRTLHGRGFQILGVNQQDSPSDAGAFAGRLNIPYPILLDRDGTVSAHYSVVGLPTSMLVDGNGVVRWVKAGVVDQRDLNRSIEPVIKGQPYG